MSKGKKQVKLWTKDFVFVIIINFLVFLNHLMILSTFPFFISYLGYPDTVSGVCATVFSLVAVVCRPFVGWMLDNGKRKVILLLGLLGMATALATACASIDKGLCAKTQSPLFFI